MSIPFNSQLGWDNYLSNPNWHQNLLEPELAPLSGRKSQMVRAVNEIFVQTLKQGFVRSIQFIRDAARLVLKVPIRLIRLPHTWQELERAKINAKLPGYSLAQVGLVPVKFCVSIVALATLVISLEKGKWLLDKSEQWTAHLDGCASRLEALKEEGRPNAESQEQYGLYKQWLYSIDPKLCRKEA